MHIQSASRREGHRRPGCNTLTKSMHIQFENQESRLQADVITLQNLCIYNFWVKKRRQRSDVTTLQNLCIYNLVVDGVQKLPDVTTLQNLCIYNRSGRPIPVGRM